MWIKQITQLVLHYSQYPAPKPCNQCHPSHKISRDDNVLANGRLMHEFQGEVHHDHLLIMFNPRQAIEGFCQNIKTFHTENLPRRCTNKPLVLFMQNLTNASYRHTCVCFHTASWLSKWRWFTCVKRSGPASVPTLMSDMVAIPFLPFHFL